MESAKDIMQKIPQALHNLQVPPLLHPRLANYIHNLVLHVLTDPAVRKQLKDDPVKLINSMAHW